MPTQYIAKSQAYATAVLHALQHPSQIVLGDLAGKVSPNALPRLVKSGCPVVQAVHCLRNCVVNSRVDTHTFSDSLLSLMKSFDLRSPE